MTFPVADPIIFRRVKHPFLAIILLVLGSTRASALGPAIASTSGETSPDALKDLSWGWLKPGELKVDFGGSSGLAGMWIRWKRLGEGIQKKIRVRLPGVGSVPGGAVIRHRTWLGTFKNQWIHRIARQGDDVVVDVEVPPRVRFEVLWVPLAGYEDFSRSYQLSEDPGDPYPLGARRPLILIHGLMFSHPQIPLARMIRSTFLNNFRKNPHARGLRTRFKVYHFEYPSQKGARLAAQQLVGQVRALYPDGEVPADDVVLVAHSLGGLVARQAMNTDGFGDGVQRLFTLATPHHGTLIASVANGNWNMREKIPEFDYWILRKFTGLLLPDCPALWDLRWDDHDGQLGKPEYASYEIPLNDWLKQLNASDAYLGKLTAYMGDCPRMPLRLQNLPLDYIRGAQGIFGDAFKNSDPLVPFASGTFEGAPVTRRVVPKVTHVDWVFLPHVLTPVIEEIADLPSAAGSDYIEASGERLAVPGRARDGRRP